MNWQLISGIILLLTAAYLIISGIGKTDFDKTGLWITRGLVVITSIGIMYFTIRNSSATEHRIGDLEENQRSLKENLVEIESKDDFSDEKVQGVVDEIEAGYVEFFNGEKRCITIIPNLAYSNSQTIARSLIQKLKERGYDSKFQLSAMSKDSRKKSAEVHGKLEECLLVLVNFK